jgi:hypothetical protein
VRGLETIAIVTGLLAGMVGILDLALRINTRRKRRADHAQEAGSADDGQRPQGTTVLAESPNALERDRHDVARYALDGDLATLDREA